MPPYFAGLLSEGLRLKALVRRLKTSEDDMFSLLVASGMDPVGDIHFKNPETTTDDNEESIPADFNQLRQILKAGENPGSNSLAGVQDKLSADRISLPLTSKKRGLGLFGRALRPKVESTKKTWDRYHQEDACQFLNRYPAGTVC